jgi:hypothetical protein
MIAKQFQKVAILEIVGLGFYFIFKFEVENIITN